MVIIIIIINISIIIFNNIIIIIVTVSPGEPGGVSGNNGPLYLRPPAATPRICQLKNEVPTSLEESHLATEKLLVDGSFQGCGSGKGGKTLNDS